MLEKIIKFLCLIVVILISIFILTKCKYAEITDIVNEETKDLLIENKKDFDQIEHKEYEFNGVVFKPYFDHTSSDDSYTRDDYSLMLFAFKIDENKKVVLHSVSIEEQKRNGIKIEEDLEDKELVFETNDNGLYRSGFSSTDKNMLIPNIIQLGINVKDGRRYKVLLNVEVIENEVSSNKILEFNFKAEKRMYIYPDIAGW